MKTLLALGIAHVIGDYLFQPEKLVNAKARKFGWLALHALLYTAAMSIVFFCSPPQYAAPALGIIAGSHFAIDGIRILIEKKYNKPKLKVLTFCTDQLLHLAIIAACWLLFLRHNQTSCFLSFSSLQWTKTGLMYIAMLCIIWDPTAVLIKKTLEVFPQSDKKEASGDYALPVKTGALIGKLERLIVLALTLSGATSAIGFVLAAKSIARFKQFEDKSFSERYLIGTLLSVCIALFTAIAFSKIPV